MSLFYQNAAGSDSQAPACASCGSRSWEATRPSRLRPDRHPQDRAGWIQRSVGVFFSALGGAGALTAIAVLGAASLPGWALWLLVASAVSVVVAGVVAIDGLAVESKSCALRCTGCGVSFVAPWRPRH